MQFRPIFSPLCLPAPLSGGPLLTLWARGPSLLLNFDDIAPCIVWAISIEFVVISVPSWKDHSHEQDLAVACLHPGTKDHDGDSACSTATGNIPTAEFLGLTRSAG